MFLYHGSNNDIEIINLAMCRPYKDFGRGFYLTELKEQAEKMAIRVAKIHGGIPIVNIYEIADDFMESKEIRCRDFGKKVSIEWAVFVMNNRNRYFEDYASNECNLDNKYDIVAGPIADDDMVVLFRQYQNGMIDFDTLVKGMTYKEITSQYSFHSEKAIRLLKKVGVIDE